MRRPLPPAAPGESAVNAVPPPVLLLFLALALIEAALSLGQGGYAGGPGGIGWRARAVEALAWSPAVQEAILQGRGGWRLWARALTYPLVHWGALHAVFAGALLLALGKFVGEAMGGLAALLVLAVASVAGAFAFGAAWEGAVPLVGAFPGVYGLIGAFTFVLWTRLGERGARGAQRLQAFRLIGALLAVQLLFGVLFGSDPSWVAEVAGFCAGFAVAPLLAPGGLAALRARLRGR